MKPAHLLLLGFATYLTVCPPPSHRETSRPSELARADYDSDVVGQATRNLAFWVTELQRTSDENRAVASHSVGNLWIEVGRLKRGGQRVRTIEWQVSELEESLRRNAEDDGSRRHLLNSLNYEVQALNRRED